MSVLKLRIRDSPLPVQFKRRETILRRPNAINSTNEANGYGGSCSEPGGERGEDDEEGRRWLKNGSRPDV